LWLSASRGRKQLAAKLLNKAVGIGCEISKHETPEREKNQDNNGGGWVCCATSKAGLTMKSTYANSIPDYV